MIKFGYIIKRLFLMLITLVGITFITFFVMKMAPSDPVKLKLMFAENLSPEALAAILKSSRPTIELSDGYLNFSCRVADFFQGPSTMDQVGAAHPSLVFIKKIYSKEQLCRTMDFRSVFTSMKWIGENTVFYQRWLFSVAKLNFGLSEKDKRPVIEKIKEALPLTLTLNIITIFIIYFVTIPLGMWSARHQGSLLDKVIMVKLFVFYSLPEFWVATMLLVYFAGGDYFNLFPLQGFESDFFREMSLSQKIFDLSWYKDVVWHLVLPVIAQTIGSFAFLARFSRSNFLDVIRQDYIRTARAKGLSENRVLYRHVLRNAMIPFVTMMSTLLPALLGGSVVIEQIFSVPGMGMLAFESVLSRDQNVIMGIATIGAFLTLLSLLLSDLLYAVVDPRITIE